MGYQPPNIIYQCRVGKKTVGIELTKDGRIVANILDEFSTGPRWQPACFQKRLLRACISDMFCKGYLARGFGPTIVNVTEVKGIVASHSYHAECELAQVASLLRSYASPSRKIYDTREFTRAQTRVNLAITRIRLIREALASI